MHTTPLIGLGKEFRVFLHGTLWERTGNAAHFGMLHFLLLLPPSFIKPLISPRKLRTTQIPKFYVPKTEAVLRVNQSPTIFHLSSEEKNKTDSSEGW